MAVGFEGVGDTWKSGCPYGESGNSSIGGSRSVSASMRSGISIRSMMRASHMAWSKQYLWFANLLGWLDL